jgi:pilus assembly protein CpaE
LSSALARVDAAEPAPTVLAYLLDGDSENLMRGCFADIGVIDWQVVRGGIDRAIEELAGRAAPRLVIIDVSGLADPVLQLRRLAEKSEAGFEVIVIGDRNDIVLYRDLKSIGVAEYFFKPLIVPLINRALGAILDGRPAYAAARTGVLGVRGGVGATTVATNLAWHIAAGRERSVALLDLDLQGGDCALQLDAEPSPALREALDHPDRIDDVFIAHAVRQIAPRLHLLASLEELGRRLMPREDAVLQLLQRLQANYRYVLVDLPLVEALRFPRLLELPGTVLLVSTGTASCAREIVRWRERLGPNTAERSLLHILNKRGSKESLREDQLSQVIGRPADVAIPFSSAVALADRIGTRAVQKLGVIQRSMSAISWQVAGRVSEPPLPRWRRIFARPCKGPGGG